MNVGLFYRPGAFRLDEARQWIYAYLLTRPSHQPPIAITQVTPPKELLSWLGISWREPAPTSASSRLPNELLYQDEERTRLRLSALGPLRYLDADKTETALVATDPVVFLAGDQPSEALSLAEQAIENQLDMLASQTPTDDAVTLLIALRHLHQEPLLLLREVAPIEADGALPSLSSLRQQGFLPQAIFNLLCLLCWPVPEGAWGLSQQLLWPLSALPGPSHMRFELPRLRTFNEVYLRSLSFEELGELLAPFLQEKGLWQDDHSQLQWAKLARDELSTLADVEHLRYLVDCTLVGPDNVEPEALRVMREESSLSVLSFARDYFAKGEQDFHALRTLIEKGTGAKRKKLFYPLRIALTGRIYGPSFPEILPFLGAKKCLARVEYWLQFLTSKQSP
jgi:hypothetical protein